MVKSSIVEPHGARIAVEALCRMSQVSRSCVLPGMEISTADCLDNAVNRGLGCFMHLYWTVGSWTDPLLQHPRYKNIMPEQDLFLMKS